MTDQTGHPAIDVVVVVVVSGEKNKSHSLMRRTFCTISIISLAAHVAHDIIYKAKMQRPTKDNHIYLPINKHNAIHTFIINNRRNPSEIPFVPTATTI